MVDQELWLRENEQQLWREYLTLIRKLLSVLDQELQRECGISFAEYEVLVHLSEAPDLQLRMAALADTILISRSGLTRRVDQMIKDGLVKKDICLEDKRGVFAQLTPYGAEVLQAAAPVHVSGVREYFINSLKPAEISRLHAIFLRLNSKILL